MDEVAASFPLFPLPVVALPGEAVPLHVFEPRYRALAAHCLEGDAEFGILLADDAGERSVGCACTMGQVLERYGDGRLDVLCRGTRPFRVVERTDDVPYPTATVAFLDDPPEDPDPVAAARAREAYAQLLREVAERDVEDARLQALDAYAMAATIRLDTAVRQRLLELRSENARLALLGRVVRDALERLDVMGRAAARARSNGHVPLR